MRRSIAINDCAITDEWIDNLASMPSIEELDVRGNRLTDAALTGLRRLPRLKQLRLGYGRNELTDQGMKSLSQIQTLSFVDISNTQVGDEGLRSLEALRNLTEVRIGKSKITAEGISRFQYARFGVRIGP